MTYVWIHVGVIFGFVYTCCVISVSVFGLCIHTCHFGFCALILVFLFNTRFHIGVTFRIRVNMLVSFWDRCIRFGVIFGFVYSYWCSFGIRVLAVVYLYLCIRIDVTFWFVHACLCHFGTAEWFISMSFLDLCIHIDVSVRIRVLF